MLGDFDEKDFGRKIVQFLSGYEGNRNPTPTRVDGRCVMGNGGNALRSIGEGRMRLGVRIEGE